MRLHWLQHVSFEGLANIAVWAEQKGHSLSRTALYDGDALPELSAFDWLVIMGGPMNVYEENTYPWLKEEKRFIDRAIGSGKGVLGVCLGAQLIAAVLGGAVYQNAQKEIGWHPVNLTRESTSSPIFSALPGRFTAFHWHGDTFQLPSGCVRVAESEGCASQAFVYGDRVVGLQFHLESSVESIQLLIQHCGHELVAGKFVQTADEMVSSQHHLLAINGVMNSLLDELEREWGRV